MRHHGGTGTGKPRKAHQKGAAKRTTAVPVFAPGLPTRVHDRHPGKGAFHTAAGGRTAPTHGRKKLGSMRTTWVKHH